MHEDQTDINLKPWLNQFQKDLFETTYKAVGTKTGRHGVRLENAFWKMLEAISKELNCSVGELVQNARQFETTNNNVTSAIRVGCLEWLAEKQNALEGQTDDQMVRNIINASPSAAIALSVDKRLHSFNRPFLQKVADSFNVIDLELIPAKLRWVLDIQVVSLVEQLRDNGNKPIAVGMALGFDDRRIRSQLNVVMAPRLKQDVILGYLLQ